MNPTMGLGSKAMVTGAISALAAFLTAAVHAGWDWYTDPSVVTLLVTAVGAVVALFTGRSWQAVRLTDAADAVVARDYEHAAEPLRFDTRTDVPASDVPGAP